MRRAVALGVVGVFLGACGGAQTEPVAASPTAAPSPSEATNESMPPPAPAKPKAAGGRSDGAAKPRPAAFADAEDLTCATRARELKGKEANTSRLVHCPDGCATEPYAVWGTNLYTDDSSVCRALVHAGVLREEGGFVRITFLDGLMAYVGSEQHAIRSASYGKWRRSFYGQALDAEGQPTTPAPTVPPEGTVRIDCSHRGRVVGDKPASSLILVCPSGCADEPYNVWGSGPYTSDSNACAAAIHAGVIPADGGKVRVTMAPGQAEYTSSERNGIKTYKYDEYGASFTVKALK